MRAAFLVNEVSSLHCCDVPHSRVKHAAPRHAFAVVIPAILIHPDLERPSGSLHRFGRDQRQSRFALVKLDAFTG